MSLPELQSRGPRTHRLRDSTLPPLPETRVCRHVDKPYAIRNLASGVIPGSADADRCWKAYGESAEECRRLQGFRLPCLSAANLVMSSSGGVSGGRF